jgi:hypothetical protein
MPLSAFRAVALAGACLLAVSPGRAGALEQTRLRPPCGMSRLLEAGFEGSGPTGRSARIAATEAGKMHGRVLVAEPFALHYTLGKNTHQPVWTPADAGLKASRDSLLTVFAALATAPGRNPDSAASSRDSAVNAALDRMGAPHPLFIRQAAAYFENARAYFADTLGMLRVDSNIADYFAGSIPGKFNVDVANIDELLQSPGISWDETYGATFPPTSLGGGKYYSANLILENDFLYNSRLDHSTGNVTGDTLKVFSQGAPLHNYNREWDAGLAVTIAHEFYHAVQIQYTPTVRPQHAWYELGGVAMEERLAGTINDYLSYLPAVLNAKAPVSLLQAGGTANYGNGIFHLFLSSRLGNAFDVAVWEQLRTNGNNLPNALLAAVGGQARWDSLHAAYAVSLSIAGLPGSTASPLAFSSDFELWPRPLSDSARSGGSSPDTLPPLSHHLIKPVPAAVTWATLKGMPGAWRVAQSGSGFSSAYLADSVLPLRADGPLAFVVPNSSFFQTGYLTLKREGSASGGIAAFPNPASGGAAISIRFSAPANGSMDPLVVLSESGKRMATLAADASGTFWSWNFRDPQNRILAPGVYYYGTPGKTPQTLLVLP